MVVVFRYFQFIGCGDKCIGGRNIDIVVVVIVSIDDISKQIIWVWEWCCVFQQCGCCFGDFVWVFIVNFYVYQCRCQLFRFQFVTYYC